VYSVPDKEIFLRRNFATAQEFGAEFFVMNLDSANSQMASDLVIIHRRTELVAINVDPQSRILHYGQEEERLLVYGIVVSTKKGKQFDKIARPGCHASLGLGKNIVRTHPSVLQHLCAKVSY
jgi:hypothetical protein